MNKFTLVFTLSFIILLSGCYSSNGKLANKMIEKYSDDQNYVVLTGEIVGHNNNQTIIKCEELKKHIKYQSDICKYYIHSEYPLELSVGDIIEFSTVPYHFYNGHKLPIVELKKNGEILLGFEEGKSNLLDWVNKTFADDV